jgi:hypothetical protein
MSLQVKRNTSSDITSSIDWPSTQLTLVLTKEVSTFQFSVRKTGSNVIPAVGDQIDIYESGNHIFGGTVTESEATVDGGLLLIYQITCTDWSFKMDTKLVAKTYAQMDPHDIVVDIINNYTTGGYTTAEVQVGNFLVPSIKFNYEPVTKAIQKLASLIGWDWYVDADKGVHFFLAEDDSAPFNIDDSGGNLEWQTLDVDVDLTNMKNSVYVIGGNYKKTFTASTTPDVYQTDGVASVYSLAYSYDKSTVGVTLDGVAQTIGIANQVSNPSSVQVLYNPDNRYIQFTTTPGSGHTVKIYGQALVPILAHAQDAAGIAAYGEIQDSVVDKQITTVPEAQARAQAEILQYGHAVYTVKFNTLKTGLTVGQTITVNSSAFGLDVPLTIKRITGTGYTPSQFEYQVECYGSDQVSFVDIMSVLLQQENQQNPVTDTTILEVLQSIADGLSLAEAVAVTTGARPYKWGATTPQARWGFATWG